MSGFPCLPCVRGGGRRQPDGRVGLPHSVREKYEPRFWRRTFGIFPLIFLAILGYCFVIASRQGAFCESSAYAKHCALIACRSSFSKFFTKNFEKKLRSSPKVQSNQKRQDVRLRQGERRRACPVARSSLSTQYERAVSAFDRVRITPLHYSKPIHFCLFYAISSAVMRIFLPSGSV